MDVGTAAVDDDAAACGVVNMTEPAAANARDLELELDWFARVLDHRFRLYFRDPNEAADATLSELETITPPPPGDSLYGRFVAEHGLDFGERVTLILTLTPHLRPLLLDVFRTRNRAFDRPFTQFGCVGRGSDDELLPTGETLAFILGGDDLACRFAVTELLSSEHAFARDGVLDVVAPTGQSLIKAPLRISPTYLGRFTTGSPPLPALGVEFPAQRLYTQLDWDDLVLPPNTIDQVAEIAAWLEHGDTLMREWGMAARLRPGHRALFHGPPGTGKTLTAALLGKSTGRPVYRVDLSLVVSKFIGETEKNLAKVFDFAQRQGWILFFDEADALFGRRSEVRDAHDRYANQEVAYLLQRIESFDGILILASNLRDNLDEAFTRRFESVIYFPLPRPNERHRLWVEGFSARAPLDGVDLQTIAREHELSGGSIMNVIRHVSLRSLQADRREITRADIVQGIRRELAKEGKSA
jgi:hypothetical protein